MEAADRSSHAKWEGAGRVGSVAPAPDEAPPVRNARARADGAPPARSDEAPRRQRFRPPGARSVGPREGGATGKAA
ncbi:hypothetical protein GCM10010254_09480 [Streptomyces chromofuscus]|nr:hypothetical protein GCM10010254_09480 [Streptomyces chromofuscus]